MINLNLGDTQLIIRACQKYDLLRNQVAYVLATAYWETARTMKPVREYGGEKYLRSKKYYPYVGMGYVQLTWRANYKKASDELGVDFLADPRKLLKPQYAAEILVVGMKEGWFTSRSLSNYITLQKSDFVNARRIINGVDKKNEIAAIARDYDKALKEVGYGETKVLHKPAPEAPTAAQPGKSMLTSTTVWSTAGLGAVGSTMTALSDFNEYAQILAVVAIIAGVVWVIRERKKKSVLYGV